MGRADGDQVRTYTAILGFYLSSRTQLRLAYEGKGDGPSSNGEKTLKVEYCDVVSQATGVPMPGPTARLPSRSKV